MNANDLSPKLAWTTYGNVFKEQTQVRASLCWQANFMKKMCMCKARQLAFAIPNSNNKMCSTPIIMLRGKRNFCLKAPFPSSLDSRFCFLTSPRNPHWFPMLPWMKSLQNELHLLAQEGWCYRDPRWDVSHMDDFHRCHPTKSFLIRSFQYLHLLSNCPNRGKFATHESKYG